MPKYRIADLLIEIEARYELTKSTCRDYLVETDEVPDFSIAVSEEEIAATHAGLADCSLAYAENYAIFRKIATEAAERGAVLLHAAVIEVDGCAYAFSAPSGTGKSTHILLWRKRLGKRVDIINGDKPFLRIKDGVLTVYGSPFSGKEGWQRNASAPLKGLCFLFRAEENSIERLMDERTIMPRVFAQMLKTPSEKGISETLRCADTLIKDVPIYTLGCNISLEAAEIAFRAMTGLDLPPLPDAETI